MAFLRSLFAGVSALRNHQTMMDVIGNNIANINTVGFKSGRATFSELYAQTLRGASRPTGDAGGTNPMQVGLGMSVNTLDTMFLQGGIETTSLPYDLAIFGSAFFVVNKDGQPLYTRAGNFYPDANGRLANGAGAVLQGKMADASGRIPTGTTLEDIVINNDLKSPAKATENIKYSGNLDASAGIYNAGPPETGGITTASITVYDSLGNRIPVTMTYTKSGTNTWDWTASVPDPAPATTSTVVGNGTMTFSGTDGSLQPPTVGQINITPTSGADPLSIDLNLAGVSQNAGTSGITPREQDGYAAGTLKNVSIDATGQLLGSFSNGTVQTLAQVMLAEFNNASGLERIGENMFNLTGNSGTPAIVTAGETSKIYAGSLEQSNVDLADEFTKMITAQRGFQASARIITTSDEFLQEVVNLKR